MNTPIYDFLQSYADSDTLRLHMPGHKGKAYCSPLAPLYPLDITEIKGADELFAPDGIIFESEKNATTLFNTKGTFYSTQGSTLGIQTMLALCAKEGAAVVAPRNVHKAFINTCVLLDLDISWVYPIEKTEYSNLVSYEYTVEDIERAINKAEKPCCIYITSPDYYGRMADISSISMLSKKYNLPLLVDNAHGAHLAFIEKNIHPIALGADMCCDSAHKMLPVLTGGAYLHIGNEKYLPFVKDTMSLFASTSPSYLIMCSLDLCNSYIDTQIKEDILDAIKCTESIKSRLSPFWNIVDSEPLRLTILTSSSGLTGREVAEMMRGKNIECEYADEDYIVFLFSPLNSFYEFEMLFDALMSIKQPRIRLEQKSLILPQPEKVMSVRKATFLENEIIPVEKAEGRICGKTRVSCPPGIAVAAAGEIIDADCITVFKSFGINEINVVK